MVLGGISNKKIISIGLAIKILTLNISIDKNFPWESFKNKIIIDSIKGLYFYKITGDKIQTLSRKG